MSITASYITTSSNSYTIRQSPVSNVIEKDTAIVENADDSKPNDGIETPNIKTTQEENS